MAAIARTPVESGPIKSIGYDPDTQTLAVEFHSGGVHHYKNVPLHEHVALMDAPSKGKHFHSFIRTKFESEKQDDLFNGRCHLCGDSGPQGQTCRDCGCTEYR